MLAEPPGKVALVGEARFERDLRDGLIGLRESSRGPVQPQPSDVVSNGSAKPKPERAREVHGVHACLVRQLNSRERLEKTLMEQPLGLV